jgi:hypothetical protein
MFSKLSAIFVAAALATGVMSAPTYKSNAIGMKFFTLLQQPTNHFTTASRGQSFDNWGGISSLSGFDNFYGSDDFAHFHNFNQVVVKQDSELVCHSEQVTIIQQRLAVLQEMAKKFVRPFIPKTSSHTF